MSGGSDSAQKAAQAQQEQQQAQIEQSQSQINAIFDDPQRAADINDFVDATRQYYQQDLDKQKANADRSLKFSLAKAGLTGGSQQVDEQEQEGEAYAKGQLQAEQKALGAGASLQDADEQARQRLIALATSGLTSSEAGMESAQAVQTDLQSAQAQANADSLGDVFSTFNNFSKNVDTAQQQRDAYKQLYSLYGPIPSSSGYGGAP